MALVLEDGTGITGANSYVSVSDAQDILDDYGYINFPTEGELIKASLYLDMNLEPASYILTDDQGLLFPREKFKDSQGREVEGITQPLKLAVCIIAAVFLDEDLFESEPGITREDYGSSSVYFATPSSKPRKVTEQLNYLKRLGYGSSSSSFVELVRA